MKLQLLVLLALLILSAYTKEKSEQEVEISEESSEDYDDEDTAKKIKYKENEDHNYSGLQTCQKSCKCPSADLNSCNIQKSAFYNCVHTDKYASCKAYNEQLTQANSKNKDKGLDSKFVDDMRVCYDLCAKDNLRNAQAREYGFCWVSCDASIMTYTSICVNGDNGDASCIEWTEYIKSSDYTSKLSWKYIKDYRTCVKHCSLLMEGDPDDDLKQYAKCYLDCQASIIQTSNIWLIVIVVVFLGFL